MSTVLGVVSKNLLEFSFGGVFLGLLILVGLYFMIDIIKQIKKDIKKVSKNAKKKEKGIDEKILSHKKNKEKLEKEKRSYIDTVAKDKRPARLNEIESEIKNADNWIKNLAEKKIRVHDSVPKETSELKLILYASFFFSFLSALLGPSLFMLGFIGILSAIFLP